MRETERDGDRIGLNKEMGEKYKEICVHDCVSFHCHAHMPAGVNARPPIWNERSAQRGGGRTCILCTLLNMKFRHFCHSLWGAKATAHTSRPPSI